MLNKLKHIKLGELSRNISTTQAAYHNGNQIYNLGLIYYDFLYDFKFNLIPMLILNTPYCFSGGEAHLNSEALNNQNGYSKIQNVSALIP